MDRAASLLLRCAIGFVLVVAGGMVAVVPVASSQAAQTPTSLWEPLVEDTFDAGLGAGWMVTDTSTLDGGEYTWAAATFTATSPITAVWAVGGGADGRGLVAGHDPYPSRVDSWLIYGPVDVSAYAQARVSFNWWLDSAWGDPFSWCILTGVETLAPQTLAACTGPQLSGPIRAWVHTRLPLDVSNAASATTYVVFRFSSDEDGMAGKGAFLDDFAIEVLPWQKVYLPLVLREPPSLPAVPVAMRNADFEEDWSTLRSTRCIIYHTDGRVEDTTRDNILTPPGWVTWFRMGWPAEHDPFNPVGWGQPEVRDARACDPDRMHDGEKGQVLFTFYRIHDGGFYQQVGVTPGARLRFSAWAHAWSNLGESSPHPSDPRWSEGAHVGYAHFFALAGTPELDVNDRNFTFWVGIDPWGGTNPYAETVVWGEGAHIYNAYARVPAAQAVAQADRVTVFLRSRTLWPFKHNDAYWDTATLEATP